MTSRILVLLLAAAAGAQTMPEIRWSFGPAPVVLGGVASIRAGKDQIYVQGAELGRFLEASGNPPTGHELAVVGPADLHWFAVLGREDRIGVEELRKAIVDGTDAANLIRARQGRATLDVLGYRERPRFDAERQVLGWSLDSAESGGRAVVNRFVYFMGRDAVIGVEMVTERAGAEAAQREFDSWVTEFRFAAGHEPAPPTDWGLWVVLGVSGLSAAVLMWRWRRRRA
ncbi:DUF2167 domain-containing protein [Paludibaculum fermentans]|uniref:DUF2167 domain-containing protein n=1 Tax=Paludibaculum fermentans TaxID=1473598 RepID=A0A7S7NM20_PALFE|nr:DUF2167 domain-containing protein [Paludibaculum fermentans]QOY86126.1 DUF2167 domain-containing protein [Paludibaculum fermentans]